MGQPNERPFMLRKLFSKKEIASTVKRLAREIENDFPDEEIFFVCLLKGSFMFTSDLVRNIRNPSKVDFMRVSSYGKAMKSGGKIKITKDLEEDIEGKNVIVVEDIIDSGLTLSSVSDMLKNRNPKTFRICSLIDKKVRREIDIEGDNIVVDEHKK